MATYLNFDVGGRPYNSQDFASMQGQIIDATQIYAAFNSGNNYIIQGVTTRGAAGTIWLAGKVRAVQADLTITNSTPFPLWIIAQDSQISRVYNDGQAKVAFNVFNAIWSTTAPAPGIDFLIFNSQTDLDDNRLVTFITPDAIPVAGGTYTGEVVFNEGLRVGGIGPSLIRAKTSNQFKLGLGNNIYFNGSNYVTSNDGSNNGASFLLQDGYANSDITLGILPTTGGSNRILSNADVNNAIKMRLTSSGNLSVTGSLTANVNVNGTNIVATNALQAPQINLSKTGNSSLITFAAVSNDPGYIMHTEALDVAEMRFNVSDNNSIDFFTFGSSPPQGFVEACRIVTDGRGIFVSTVTATDFIISSDKRLKTNFNELYDGIKIINQLRPLEFDMIKDNTHKAGFIAQEVLKVIPHAVIKPEKEEEMLSLKETQIIPYLVKAVQELSEEIERLKKELIK